MVNEFLYSRCGIYCGACYVFRAERDRGDFLRYVSEWQGVPPSKIKCSGCFAPDNEKWPNCRKCWPWRCLSEKGLDNCYECKDFWEKTCKEYIELEEFCLKRGENIRENMINMKKNLEKWLDDQKRKWKCNNCGASFSWYEEYCHNCGNNLNRKDLNFEKSS